MKQSTLSIVQDLKNANQDFEWYPTTTEQIKSVTDDINSLRENFDFKERYKESIKVLDVGAGDGRVLQAIKDSLNDDDFNIDTYAIEKSTIHTSTYRSKNITLLGTEFNQINFISKSCNICFVNPPYSEFSYWLQTLIRHLNFNLLYAVVPQRWIDDKGIKDAMEYRGIKFTKVLLESDFLNAERAARAKVNIVRFSFSDFSLETLKKFNRDYKPPISICSTEPFQLFLENELGLKKTYSQTTERFNEYVERERVKTQMNVDGSQANELVKTKGVLWALLDNYENDLDRTLNQYKKISEIDPNLLQELGVDYEGLRTGAKEKLLGYRNVYWALLFEKLDTISNRLTSKYKKKLLDQLSSNALDFTYTNAIYIVSYAVEIGNELIEEGLVEVFKNLTSEESISRYYKSNQHIYKDDWRYTQTMKEGAKYLLDYRFIHSGYDNFADYYSSVKGLNENTRNFTDDLVVAFKLLGYNNLQVSESYSNMTFGDRLSINGTDCNGDEIELATIKYYKNGSRHLKFNQEAMLRFNVTVSRILGWVRNKEEFNDDSETKTTIDDSVWEISDDMKITANNVLLLTNGV